jgi:DNA-binding NtrC family response regulator
MADDTILVVDDESDLVQGLRRTIRLEIDCRVLTAENGLQALDILSKEAVDVVLADVLMPHMDGLTLLERIKSLDPAVTVIIMTAYGTIEKAVDAIKKGAYDLIQKPMDENRLIHLLRKGLELNRLVRENARLSEAISPKGDSRQPGRPEPAHAGGIRENPYAGPIRCHGARPRGHRYGQRSCRSGHSQAGPAGAPKTDYGQLSGPA